MKKAKIMFALGIVAGLAAVSAKAQCDGPVLVPGLTAGQCNCHNNDTTSGTGSCQPSSSDIGIRNPYYKCGGDGYTYCTTANQTVGWDGVGCIDTFDINAQQIALRYYNDCLDPNNPPGLVCTYEFCYFNACSMDTTGATGTPIVLPVENGLGDDCGGG